MESDSGTKDNVRAFKKKWSHEEIYASIDFYEAIPCLWDVSSKEYHNSEVTTKKHKH